MAIEAADFGEFDQSARRTATGWYFPACDLADRLGFTVSGLSGETRLSRGTLRLELRRPCLGCGGHLRIAPAELAAERRGPG